MTEQKVLRGSPRFPQELCDLVIDHLHDEPAALKACSLVCRAWFPSTDLYLFSTLVFPPCPDLWNPRKRLQTGDSETL
ncbi:uncharacterized protein PHACADRAFT_96476 [Phanerochaete carnosa HHB-10118-sp]|uniref:F-box domain-containing protein n=1 Tax=Phanerochaete carnosa (strain HHB-10118-sp) TaxID=650164 RepID=K5W4I4_PHACS|nr:uncharacterized protein PHACADRAFT_96476 [Phanerochaete carnosa HHB-10118-sp]EKM54075.1 hypothetical protein PHACADRAFT_96476 [Phanerochaete carnosa HHB-10118-sp]